jgi:hypothetical protein
VLATRLFRLAQRTTSEWAVCAGEVEGGIQG